MSPIDPSPGAPTRSAGRAPSEDQKTLFLTDTVVSSADASASYSTSTTLVGLSAATLAVVSRRYEILAAAGHGSMGDVYKALDRETGETIALKILKPEIASDQAMMERFKNELLFARKITHKNVCRVHEFNRVGGIAYTSMEFVEGESLRSVLNRFGSLPPRKAVDIVQQICSGLKEAHAQGIVHRDLKPENIMIDAQGNVKIMDFGIARSMEAAATRLTGSMVGTPAYMAPEQAAGKAVDYRTDVYSLGLIAYEIFTGTPAFRADNAVAVALKQMNEKPQPPHELDPNISPLIERTILKCLEKDPARRYQTITEVEVAFRVPGSPLPPAARAASTTAVEPGEFAPGIPAADAPLRATRFTPPKERSAATLLFSWLLLFAALGGAGYAARRWVAPIAFPNLYSLPSAPSAPEPPDSALETKPPVAESQSAPSVSPSPADATPPVPAAAAASDVANEKDSADSPPAPAASASTVNTSVPVPSAPVSVKRTVAAKKTNPAPAPAEDASAPESAAQPVTQEPGANARPNATVGSFANSSASSYIWAGRYEMKDRADAAAKEIRDLGLQAIVLPRDGQRGQFFIVLTGPFGPKKASDVKDLLQADGFANARVFKTPEAGGTQPAGEN